MVDIFKLIEDNGLTLHGDIEHFAELIRQEEREKVAAWMIQRGYATGHGDTIEDLLQELEWQIREQEQAEKQEPVAWQGVHDKTDLYYRKPPQADVRPLYTTPQPQEFVCSTGLCRFTLTQTGVGIGERGMQAYEEAKKRGWVGISDELESPQPSEQGVSDETGRHDRNA